METIEHTSVGIVNELIRLTIAGHTKWTRCVVDPKEHNFYKPNHDARESNKSLLVRYETDVLGKPVYLGELDGTPRWVVVDGETVCRSTDEYLKSYITNPVKSLWRILEGKVANDAISVPVTEWLQRLKETNKADA